MLFSLHIIVVKAKKWATNKRNLIKHYPIPPLGVAERVLA